MEKIEIVKAATEFDDLVDFVVEFYEYVLDKYNYLYRTRQYLEADIKNREKYALNTGNTEEQLNKTIIELDVYDILLDKLKQYLNSNDIEFTEIKEEK